MKKLMAFLMVGLLVSGPVFAGATKPKCLTVGKAILQYQDMNRRDNAEIVRLSDACGEDVWCLGYVESLRTIVSNREAKIAQWQTMDKNQTALPCTYGW